MATPTSSPERRSFPGIAQGELISDRYRVEDRLGEGGMGMVFAARDEKTGARVALKVMRPSEDMEADAVRRFVREGRLAGSIGNPHIARVLDGGWLSDTAPYLVLELLEGESLADVLRRDKRLPAGRAIDWVLQVCEGIAAAHASGIVHRDLKPSNLFLCREDDGSEIVKVVDFGIAKAARDDLRTMGTDLTRSAAILGSPRYMSPEQLRNAREVDARSDIWALGLILHQMLSGHDAFGASSVGAHLAAIMERPPVGLRIHFPEASEELERIVARSIQKDIRRRYQDVSQLAFALLPFAGDAREAGDRVARIAAVLAKADALSPDEPVGEPTMRRTDAAEGIDAVGAAAALETIRDESKDDAPTATGDGTTIAWTPTPRADATEQTVVRRTGRGPIIGALAVIALLLVGFAAVMLSGAEVESSAPSESIASAPPAVTEPLAATADPVEVTATLDESNEAVVEDSPRPVAPARPVPPPPQGAKTTPPPDGSATSAPKAVPNAKGPMETEL